MTKENIDMMVTMTMMTMMIPDMSIRSHKISSLMRRPPRISSFQGFGWPKALEKRYSLPFPR